jgi:hypothetical protein
MDVIIQVRREIAPNLRGRVAGSPAADEILRAARDLGVTLEPLHPGATDPHLIGYFIVSAADFAAAEHIAERLRRCQAVEAAYVKPPDEMP